MKTAIHVFISLYCTAVLVAQSIPLPEHPRPDFERPLWQNLNGKWDFQFDSSDVGVREGWYSKSWDQSQITVPFPWGSELSGVKDAADIGWYQRGINVSNDWNGKRVFIVIGASDWATEAWLDGHYLGRHQGGYMPFEFELTEFIKFNTNQKITIRADDKRRDFTLYGKQGYGNARGIWQTVYLEARGKEFVKAVKCMPDTDRKKVSLKLVLAQASVKPVPYRVEITSPSGKITQTDTFPIQKMEHSTEINIPSPRLWSLDDPYLYQVKLVFAEDEVNTYFGMRKISVVKLPGTDIPYIGLNNKPIYLQLALDQSYHPKGYYTFPSDDFMKQEIIRSKSIGLNGIRIHIKPELPRKLYWADKLGLLVMADLPNSWGEPEPQMKQEAETTLKEFIERDFNHPSIFSWIVFNETWGLTTKVKVNNKNESHYLPETQSWVASMYYLAKSLDASRLVEDNSICCGRGHTQTDIYSWHEYLPGWEWDNHLKKIVENNFEGSSFHFEAGYKQGGQPNINSECGNVWGYEGSTGDVDWSYDYHRMMNSFRKYPKVAGWLYTEHHDVINEWNGYWRYDRSNKHTGFEQIVQGMTIKDLHSKYYLTTGNEITNTVNAGDEIAIPLTLSVYDESDSKLIIRSELWFTDQTGNHQMKSSGESTVLVKPWDQKELSPMKYKMPQINGLALIKFYLLSTSGDTLHRNFVHFVVENGGHVPGTVIETCKPDEHSNQKWSIKYWSVLNGLKVNGTGRGYFEYKIPVKNNWKPGDIKDSYVVMELSAKELFDKDKDETFVQNQNYMLGSRVSPSKNPNAYPMTDDQKYSSQVKLSINNTVVKQMTLEDDPADHQGILSWHAQLKDRKLREAGSYGYLIKVPISKSEVSKAKKQGFLTLKLECVDGGGIAVYGSRFGKYPVDINWVLNMKK